MADPFWWSLAIKMLASAAIVVATAAAAERTGPMVAAMIATLPVTAGPAYVILALDHDSAFIATSALHSLVCSIAHSVFVVVYALVAQRHGTLVSVAASLGLWGLAVAGLQNLSWTGPSAIAAYLVSNLATMVAIRPYLRVPPVSGVYARWFDPLFRAALVMALVGSVVIAGRSMGPAAAGIAATVPLAFTSIALVLQPRIGGAATAALFGRGMIGLIGFGLALWSIHATAVALGNTGSLLLALAISVGWNVIALAIGWRVSRKGRPEGRG